MQEAPQADEEAPLSQDVVVIADTHLPRGARRLPELCVEALRAADVIVHAGDLASVAFLEELRGYGPPVHAVHGNADEPALALLLPETLAVEIESVRLGIVHVPGPAKGREERLVGRFPGCDAVVFGHTHLPVVERHGGVWLLNPGSPTERRRGPFRSFLRLRIAGRRIRPDLVEIATWATDRSL